MSATTIFPFAHTPGAGVRLFLLGLLLGVSPALAAQQIPGEYPRSPRTNVVDTVSGVPVPDPYAWLEEQWSRETRAWVEAQTRFSDSVLASFSSLERVRERVMEVALGEEIGRPSYRDGRVYYMKRPAGAERAALYVRDGLHGEERLLLDPAEISADATVTIDFRTLYGDGRYLIYSVRQGGEDETEIRIRDLETDRDLPDRLPWAYYRNLSLNQDETGFYYTWDQDQQAGKVLFHRLGTDVEEDTITFPAARREEWVNAYEVEDGRYLLATVGHGWRRTDIFLKDLEQGGPWRPIIKDLDALFQPHFVDGALWLLTDYGAPNNRVVAVDPDRPAPENWEEILPETEEVLDGIALAGGKLWARYITEDVATRIQIHERDGTYLRELELPGEGNASLPWDAGDGKLFFQYESFTTARHLFVYDPETREREVWHRDQPPIDTDEWVVKLEWYDSPDGVQVPVHLVHREGIELDGDNPTLLYGYGGFNAAQLPSFREWAALWIEQGGIYAVAHLRGGSEFGRRWHHNGMLEFKQNVFNDFIAAAEHLIERGYTRPERLAIRGGSNGGLLMGAALTQRPELFSAVLADVPELDLVGFPGYEKINPPALEEYGDASIPEEFAWIIEWSPLQNVEQGTAYPAVILNTGDMDSRVDPVQARKMTAKLQWATTSDPDAEPILLVYGSRVGHSGGRTATESAELLARQLAFLSWQLGVDPAAEGSAPFDERLLDAFEYRNLGPFRAGGWISDIAVPERPEESHLYTIYAAARHGGLWKTTNNGTTWEPLLDEAGVYAIGDIALSPSNPDIVWVGTGDAANARSSYGGDGVYKSADGGKQWEHMGLDETHHIGRIVVHPTNPDIVYVAAMGHLYSHNPERGVYKTTDGGRTWEKVLFINERVGVIDLAMNRDDPEVIYAAAYEKERFPWHFEAGGPESAIYKTTNGGRSWERLGGGLPTGKIGRIGLDIYRSNPDVVYAVVENANLRAPTAEESAADRERGVEAQERVIGGEVYRSEDAGRSWRKMNSTEDNVGGKAAYSFNQIRIDPNDDQKVYVTSIGIVNSDDGGRSWHDIDWPPKKMFPNMFGDVRSLWIDPENSRRIIAGTDGGVHVSYDGGTTSDYYDNLPLGELYAVAVDMETPYNIYGGLQDHESWKGPSNSWSGEVTLEDWVTVGTGDGMDNEVDPIDSRWLYNTSQFGDHYRVDQKLRTRTPIEPQRPEGEEPYRFNWNPPLHISPHDSRTIYTGAQVLLRSPDRGDSWREISPTLTCSDLVKIAGQGHITYCTLTTISESPVQPGVIWTGADDGQVHVSRDGGTSWMDVTGNLARAGAPDSLWVSRVFASHHDAGTAYITKTGYRRDDFRPYVYKTTDYGRTWTSLASNLPDRPVNVIFEDPDNPELLFVGTDLGVYASIDGGERWARMASNMPPAPVHDLLVHPRENDLIVGTYGRGIFVTDITPLKELDGEVLARDLHLFRIRPQAHGEREAWGNYKLYGDRHLATPNEPNGIVIHYYLRAGTGSEATITVADRSEKILRTLEGEANAGINRVVWNLRNEEEELVEPGEYEVTLEVGDKRAMRTATVEPPRQANAGGR